MSRAQSVLIADDHPLFREALEVALGRASKNAPAIHHAGSFAAALDAMDHGPDLVLLDLTMGDTEGFDGLSRLLAAFPGLTVVVVSATETAQAVETARTLGASGYLPKSLGLDALTTAMGCILNGETWFPEFSAPGEVPEAVSRLAQLTPAQRRVLNGLADGLLNKQIAYEMGISDATVKAHMTAIMRKLGATNRTQALLIYREAVAATDDHSAA